MSMNAGIPFNKPWVAPGQLEYVRQSLESGWTAGDGPFTRRAKAHLEGWYEGAQVLLTPSCTAALEMAAMLLRLEPGDEVIVPSFTFVSTVNAFIRAGAVPRFADIDPLTLNIDPAGVERLLTARTRAIVPVHYAGVACRMAELSDLAERVGASIVEDNAQGLFGCYRNQKLGAIGRFGAVSFHETKNFICGEGGALIVNREEDHASAEIVREKGTNRSAFYQGLVDKYTWVGEGSSYLLADPLAAMLLAQLEARSDIESRRRAIYRAYSELLRRAIEGGALAIPVIPEDVRPTYHMFPIILRTAEIRRDVLRELQAEGIGAVFHYVPLHSSPFGRRFGTDACPVTDDLSVRLIRLPFFNEITLAEQEHVVARLLAAVERNVA